MNEKNVTNKNTKENENTVCNHDGLVDDRILIESPNRGNSIQ